MAGRWVVVAAAKSAYDKLESTRGANAPLFLFQEAYGTNGAQ